MTAEDTRKIRENSVGWMVQRIAGALDRDMNRRLAVLDLALPQFSVMMIVLERDGLPQTEIGETIHAPDYAISRAVDRLEQQGRIERRAHPSSRRSVAVHATKAGRALAPDLHRIVREVNQALLAPLSTDDERKMLKTLLRRILPVSDC